MLVKNLFATGFITFLFIIGYLREVFFLVVNSVLRKYPFPYNSAYITPPKFLYSLSNNTLVLLKWVFTFGFFLLFAFVTYLFINFYFRNKTFNKITLKIYILLLVVSFLVSLFGMIFNTFDEAYSLSRLIIGLAQYPLIPLVLFVLFYYKSKNIDY